MYILYNNSFIRVYLYIQFYNYFLNYINFQIINKIKWYKLNKLHKRSKRTLVLEEMNQMYQLKL